ncbi:FAD-dependent oxidoreductase [Siphonobacter sp. SORGH_AS_1065]|uniref:FAD-dependent oxidoreductase n=1 Tax=Siphonobacter sp. SORGH_AS_1065 TaxID=3041795 RepID=UPI0027839264|nr:FAD-dependent oxidoreductase [Siphonobacter sp. SORGH_AS_1065]MDQ1088351.1 hypothetical protein [Siphonobacter sp. SORGH_AS_1065]
MCFFTKVVRHVLFFLLALNGTILAQSLPVVNVDVCVYGGTSAGIIAAYTAQKLGKSVILVEPTTHLGGLTTGGLGYTDVGKTESIQGLARDFYNRVGAIYGQKVAQFSFEPKVAKKVFSYYLQDLHVQTNYRLQSVAKSGNVIKSITVQNVLVSGKTQQINASIFMDCSYEGDLMAKSGVSYTYGREAITTYKEKYNGVQITLTHQFPDHVDPYKIPGNASSGLVWGVSDKPLATIGTADNKIQAYNFRLCLTNNSSNSIPFTRPSDYDASKYELLLRLMAAQPEKTSLNDYFIWNPLPNKKVDLNNAGGFSTDMIGMNYNYVEGSPEERKDIIAAHESYTKGLLYFFGNDSRVPATLRKQMQQWGYAKDEFTDNGNWTPQLYIRESRRMVSDYVMTEANCMGTVNIDDEVAQGSYAMDSHNCQRIVYVKGGKAMVKNAGDIQIALNKPYGISYRSIVPRQKECQNLLVPVCLSASHIAYGSIRMEPVFMMLGQAAGVAAVMAVIKKEAVQTINIQTLQEELTMNPLVERTLENLTPLPLRWIYFNAQLDPEGILLKWATSYERNTQKFFIQYSFDSLDFETVDIVNASGNSIMKQEYSYLDKKTAWYNKKVIYYRLKQVDMDGKFTYSNIISINPAIDNEVISIKAYPNPFNDNISIELSHAPTSLDDNNVTLYTQDGRQVYHKKINEITLPAISINDLSTLRPGYYLMNVIINQRRYTLKMIKI